MEELSELDEQTATLGVMEMIQAALQIAKGRQETGEAV